MKSAYAQEIAVADVFITVELERREPQKTDYRDEMLALQDLAAKMVEHPEEILPRFVELAMQITGGSAGGLSLFEEHPSPGVFRWQFLCGSLSSFEGATTPRNFSPCGITLDRNAPVLSTHPERVYDWISDAHITVPEVLLVPLYVGSKEPLGTLWIVSDELGHFDRGHARAMTELARFVGMALYMQRSEERLKQALDEQETLTKEMSHRVKNLFAVVGSMIHITAKGAADKNEMEQMLSGRLQALAGAHTLIRRNLTDVGTIPPAADLRALIQAIVQPIQNMSENAPPRALFAGPAIKCGERTTNAIALVIHELVTNASKYGALSIDKGHVEISWTEDQETLVLQWVEVDGPPIASIPQTKGFGSKLVESTIVRQYHGTVNNEWRRDGLIATITVPIAKLSE